MAKMRMYKFWNEAGDEKEKEEMSLKKAVRAVQGDFKDKFIGVEYISKKGKQISQSVQIPMGRKNKTGNNYRSKTIGSESQKIIRRNMSTDSHDKDHDHDRSYENESTRDHSPMVQISLKEYDKLKEKQHFITDKALIDIIDNMERLVRALRKHIVRTEV